MARFEMGQVVITPGALAALSPEAVRAGLERHCRGDWGDLDPEDVQENERSLREGLRLLSAYTNSSGKKFWIITEADRSATTILLPEEY